MTRPIPPWRLTERGKRLYWLLRAFDEKHTELTAAEFISMLSQPIPIAGVCLSCGEYTDTLAATVFCAGCTAGSYERVD